ncbi:hypothetical protein C8J55DRAFT_498016 [Lentinula edodes]|uniref:Uncharacterized protein n=2 Tax=Lentinula TaxID=5352 RepID=A0A9W9E0D7_9AGAR|nr:hypothetical protein C8J55DRAFT_498016 [Lentinula edodes]
MQSDANVFNVEEEESLFGSPPPSPRIGRSPSPILALPSRSGSIVKLQNVGTIALPGSHYISELPVNPLALPSSFSTQAAAKPLAPFQISAGHFGGPMSPHHSSSSSTPSSSRASSQGPLSGQSKGKHGRRRREDESRVVRVPPPEIPLPDPTGPPPANWLRSQSALLGHAGLIGGVKTSTLSNRHFRGSTAKNPIVIDDNQHSNQQQHHHPSPKRSRPAPRYQLPLCLDLPAPSIQEIVRILIKQREIFPILRNILKLSRNGFPGFTKDTNNSPSPGPVPKKRKLNKVPAGAVDWDVPYPFQPGEGPEAYSATWEQTRGKQLVSQLVSLIKAASRKAAIRKYMEQDRQLELQTTMQGHDLMKEWEHAMPKVEGHYRLETTLYGLPDMPLQDIDILADASNNPVKSSDLPVRSSPAPESSPFDELLASLLTVSPKSGDLNEAAASPSNLGSLFANTGAQESTPELDQSVIDNWMSIFQTYQVPASLEETTTYFSDSSSLAPQIAGPSSIPDLPLDLGPWAGVSNGPGDGNLLPHSVVSLYPPSNIGGRPQTDSHSSDSTSFDLKSVAPSTNPTPWDTKLVTPMLPTAGYLDAFNSLIPTSSPKEYGEPYFSSGMMEEGLGGGSGGHLPMGLMDRPQELPGFDQPAKHPPNFSAVPLSALFPALAHHMPPPPTITGTSSVFTPPAVRPYNPSGRTIDKVDLLSRARERRAQLADEILKTRTQLWETTIEHGVLTRLAKLYT